MQLQGKNEYRQGRSGGQHRLEIPNPVDLFLQKEEIIRFTVKLKL